MKVINYLGKKKQWHDLVRLVSSIGSTFYLGTDPLVDSKPDEPEETYLFWTEMKRSKSLTALTMDTDPHFHSVSTGFITSPMS
ncbi:BZ3500_MvSof-1268-A1-R1_Chr11-3g03564 [Microbotryum saponariae]|uniref:BZ3500_MvSof-1268-A1-R1_Chr11-3g03564 protein n=1 Tax=Microbotryum saponariae TaxID=289078 RepID=A0A2X0LGB5_9BASI|nr:BZ3500_MvSof-1268-A1-R1_Chr11-3g03564 [Microbotryum saponariae]SDA03573.1 BZ3501_MvSof-1269-A2-R1_Chr11g03141 [Microbotryum saponariae]